MTKTDAVIVGAGLAGLMAAHVLIAHDLTVTLVDKGSSVGGRLATRRIGAGRADHGAQFFTVRAPEFADWVERWLAVGVVYKWGDGFSDGSIGHQGSDGHPRYAVHGGMNALAKYLAAELKNRPQPLQIDVNAKVSALVPKPDGWEIRTESGANYASRGLLLTPPVPQSLALLVSGVDGDPLAHADREALQRIDYAPCVAGMFHVSGARSAVNLPEPGALQRPKEAISWIADNHRKGISPDATIITVHAAPEYSRELWDVPEDQALETLREALYPFLASGTSIIEAQLKRWRYALPTVLHPERFLMATGIAPLVFAGDAFGEARVEGATLSGLAGGEALAARLI
ncbi:MAG: FAD-dependent oxidoreductase [Chloroflexota bacterium]